MTGKAEGDRATEDDSPPALQEREATPRRPPLQFTIRGLLLLTAATALLFGTMRWLGVSPEASALVLVVLMIAAAAAIGLLVAILRE
jgi:hypothetical protein